MPSTKAGPVQTRAHFFFSYMLQRVAGEHSTLQTSQETMGFTWGSLLQSNLDPAMQMKGLEVDKTVKEDLERVVKERTQGQGRKNECIKGNAVSNTQGGIYTNHEEGLKLWRKGAIVRECTRRRIEGRRGQMLMESVSHAAWRAGRKRGGVSLGGESRLWLQWNGRWGLA